MILTCIVHRIRAWQIAPGLCLCAAVIGVTLRAQQSVPQAVPAPPAAAVSQTGEAIHGVHVADPYRWLEDATTPQTKQWIAAEQAYTTSLLSNRPEMEGLRRDVRVLADLEQAQRALFRKGRYFILKRERSEERRV